MTIFDNLFKLLDLYMKENCLFVLNNAFKHLRLYHDGMKGNVNPLIKQLFDTTGRIEYTNTGVWTLCLWLCIYTYEQFTLIIGTFLWNGDFFLTNTFFFKTKLDFRKLFRYSINSPGQNNQNWFVGCVLRSIDSEVI